ncbi:MAG: sulfotransferase domain-containing protein [Chloroflexi bacterium]|nr:sulfotransferase domain-containing protein [Chloroflexota bacterium]
MSTIDAYLICGTPRTGSTLLCDLLRSTGVAGRPDSYFRLQDQLAWAERWHLPRGEDGAFDYADYLQAAQAAGRSANGVFALRVMWGTLDEIVAQAVSWARAEQTHFWHEGDTPLTGRVPHFDFAQIHDLVHTIDEHNTAWRNWFARFDVRPHVVRYEDLATDPAGVTLGILDFLGLELPVGRTIVSRRQRQADSLNAEWIARYSAMAREVK